MQIWVDADACPRVVKEIIFRAAKRASVATTLVANQELIIPASDYIDAVQVKAGLDVADNYIVQHLDAGDLAITADIPLAAAAIAQDAYVLTPRGELLYQNSIRQRLSMRNFLDELRNSGVETGGPPPLHQRDREAFANQLDRFLVKHA